MRPEMHFGHILSGTLHFIFVFWLLMGDVFSSNFEPPDYVVVEITGASEQEFQATRDLAKSPAVVAQTEVAKPIPSSDDKLETKEPKIDKEIVEVTPEVPKVPELPKDKIVLPKEIQLVDPELSVEPVQPLLSQEDLLLSPLPETTETQSPVIADRVASVPVIPENEDLFIDNEIDSLSQVPSEEDKSDLDLEEKMQSTRGATTEIITEPKKKPSGAPKSSLRPKGRPQIEKTDNNETTESPSEEVLAAVNSLLNNLESNENSMDEPSETSLSGESSNSSSSDAVTAIQKQMADCWPVDVGNQNAYVTLTVQFSLDKDGRVQGAVKLVEAKGGNDRSVRSAFTYAKRGIFKCQKQLKGFNLQQFDYENWREIIMTFDPNNMRNL